MNFLFGSTVKNGMVSLQNDWNYNYYNYVLLVHHHDTSLKFVVDQGHILTLENVLLLEPCHEAWTDVIAGINDYNPYKSYIEALETCGKGIGAKVSTYITHENWKKSMLSVLFHIF